ncbi:MAG: DNA polymerase III subunit delta [Lachnospiraceae bacterium]|nr:DNA polymerase III subunit delta [Lachnospiraceae bacterium]
MKTINADIKSGNLRRVYLIYGEEAYLRQSLKRRLREAVVGDDTMNYTYMEGKDADAGAIIEMAQTMPFFAPRRLILVENSGFFKQASEELAAYLPEMPETACLVFVEEAVDRRNKLYKRVASLGYAAECKRQTPAELKRWTARGLAQAGKKATEATVDEFLTRTGDDMENIRQELEKLIGYVGERQIVTTQDVETITTVQLGDRIFEMIDAIANRNQKKALDLYYDLLMLREPPMKIMVLIARQFRGILQVKELRERGVARDEMAQRCKLRPFQVTRYLGQASRFRREELEEYVELCVEADEAVKQGNLRDTLAAEMLIVKFTE